MSGYHSSPYMVGEIAELDNVHILYCLYSFLTGIRLIPYQSLKCCNYWNESNPTALLATERDIAYDIHMGKYWKIRFQTFTTQLQHAGMVNGRKFKIRESGWRKHYAQLANTVNIRGPPLHTSAYKYSINIVAGTVPAFNKDCTNFC